jgi:hypothetical protein
MSLTNNDYNWRLVAAVDLAENIGLVLNSAGKAAPALSSASGRPVVGFNVQPLKAGERVPVIRGGKLSGLVGFSAGNLLRLQADATLGTAGTTPVLAGVVSEDAATATIMNGNLDYLVA